MQLSSMKLRIVIQHALIVAAVFCGSLLIPSWAHAQTSLATVVAEVQPKIAKIYGAGGVRGLEHYQSGLVISADGHVLTVWSYVLDSDEVIVILNDGRRFVAQLVGSDPRLEIAVLKIEATELPYFDLNQSRPLDAGTKVLAFSNLFNVATGEEAASVQHGLVAATANLSARRGVYPTTYRGSVYVLDAVTNNPGAAGGVLTDRRGALAGMLGKELRSSLDNTWLNYAVPISELKQSVTDILNGTSRPRARPEDVRTSRRTDDLGFAGNGAGARCSPQDAAVHRPCSSRFAGGKGWTAAGRSDRVSE